MQQNQRQSNWNDYESKYANCIDKRMLKYGGWQISEYLTCHRKKGKKQEYNPQNFDRDG